MNRNEGGAAIERTSRISMDASYSALSKVEIREIMVGLGLAMLLSALDQTIVVTAMPTIGRELGDVEHLPWIVTAYLVASTAVTPLYGKLADMYGRQIMLLIGVALFMLGSLCCALANGMDFLALARGLQGMGGGGLIALSQTVVADIVSPRERGRYQTYFASVFATSSFAGPVLGGFFAEHWRWSLIFWINLPLGAFALFLIRTRLARLPQRRHPHRLDIAGALLLVLASSLLLLALSSGGADHPWTSAPILIMFAASAICWSALAWRESAAEEPLVPLTVLHNQIVRNSTLSSSLGFGTFVALTVAAPIYFEGALGLSADQSGLALIPLMAGTVAGATVSGRAMAHARHYKRLPLAGLALALFSMAFLSLKLGELSLIEVNLLLAAASVGVGAMLPVATVSVQNAVPTRDLGTATAVMQFFRQLSSAIIAAIFGAIALGGNAADILRESHAARHSPQTAAGGDFTASFSLVFAAGAALIALSLFFLARMEEKPFAEERRF
jgi:EmrB/QacA subfamily drug resistance transporter